MIGLRGEDMTRLLKDSLLVLSGDKKYDMWIKLVQTSHCASKARSKELARYGVSNIMAAVLHIVHDSDKKLTLVDLSRRLAREAHSISGLVSRMEKVGLVHKVKDLERKNMVRVKLTKKGHEVYRKTAGRECIHRMSSALSEAELEQFISYLDRIREAAYREL